MHKPSLKSTRAATLLAAVALAMTPAAMPAAEVSSAQAAAPAPAAPAPPAVQADDNADLDAQLERARKRLEQAAHEVAQLSAKVSGSMIERVMPLGEPHAIIGVQLEPGGGAAGARVREVSPGGPAAQAGIHSGDVIVAVNGTELAAREPAREIVRIMRDVKPESKVSVRVLRDGKTQEYLVTTRASPVLIDMENWPDMPGVFMFHRPLMDMELATLTPRLGGYFGSDKGVLVVRAPADGALKLEDGDVILAIDGREPMSGSHATRILSSYQPGEKITLRILRQHKSLQLEATLPEKSRPSGKDKNVFYFDDDAMRLDMDKLPGDGFVHDGSVSPKQKVQTRDGDQT